MLKLLKKMRPHISIHNLPDTTLLGIKRQLDRNRTDILRGKAKVGAHMLGASLRQDVYQGVQWSGRIRMRSRSIQFNSLPLSSFVLSPSFQSEPSIRLDPAMALNAHWPNVRAFIPFAQVMPDYDRQFSRGVFTQRRINCG